MVPTPKHFDETIKDSAFWRKRGVIFQRLAEEEDRMLPGASDRISTAHDRMLALASGDLQFGVEFVQWSIANTDSRGPADNLRERFDGQATAAGSRLHPPPGIDPVNWWFHKMFGHFRHSARRPPLGRGTNLYLPQGATGLIHLLLEASSTYAHALERVAVENEGRGPASKRAFELEKADATKVADEPEMSGVPSAVAVTKAPTGGGPPARRGTRGPQREESNALRVARIIEREAPDGGWEKKEKLERIRMALDAGDEGGPIPVPATWVQSMAKWNLQERPIVVKAIARRIKTAQDCISTNPSQ